MAAAANKPTAVHYFLVLFAFLSIILGITTYMFYNESGSKFAEIAKLNDENQKLNRSVKNSRVEKENRHQFRPSC